MRMKLDAERFYSEVHHLKPLGEHGFDNEDNMLVLCPNHHALFDYLSIGIDPSDQITIIDLQANVLGKLTMIHGHTLGESNVDYHRQRMIEALDR